MKKLLFFVFFLSGYTCISQNKYTINGYVREKGSRESLIGVPVYIPQIKSGTVTNTYGFYSITLPEQDSLTLIFSFVGYQAVVKKITLHQNMKIDVELGPNATLQEVEVVGERVEKVSQTSQMSIIDIPVEQIKDIPALLGEKDVLKVIQLMPGVQKGNEGNGGLYVRGGGSDQNLIILDDATVYNAYHLFGFFSLFNGDALKSIELIKGGFPARYGGRLSSVIDMNMKDGNKEKIHGEGGIGIVSSRLTLEGPIQKNKSSFLVSARRTYIDLLSRPITKAETDGDIVGYYFYDMNAKVNYDWSHKDKFYLSGYFGKDKAYDKFNSDGFINKFFVEWGNSTGTARWNHLYNDKLFANTSIIFSDYKFKISEQYEYMTDRYEFVYYSGIKDWTIKHDLDFFPNPKHRVRGGIVSTYHTFTPQAIQEKESSANFSYEDIRRQYATESGIYVEDEYRALPALRIYGGLRLNHYQMRDKAYLHLEPRFSSSYNIKEDLAVKASYALMNQNMHLISSTGVGLPTDLWVPATPKVAPQKSEQIAAGIAKDFLEKNLALTIEGYYKRMNNVIAYKEGANFFDVEDPSDPNSGQQSWEDKVVSGRGWSYGAEFLLQRKKGKLSGWIGYTLSWTQLQFDSISFGEKYYARYDRRHDISVVGIYKAREATAERNGITFSATWVYGTGNAITLPMSSYYAPSFDIIQTHNMYYNYATEYTKKNEFRMAPYHRFDIGLQIHKKMKFHERTWEFSIYNAYNRKNPFFYYIDTNIKGDNILKQVSLFPLIPSVSYNFKF